jgi:alpha-methylacyl-CoA racemase
MGEAPSHPHNAHRGTFVDAAGAVQAAPAPRFSRTAPELPGPAPHIGQDTASVLADHGFSQDEIAKLLESGAAR